MGQPIVELEKDEEDVNEAGRPKIGQIGVLEVLIKESKEIRGIVDKLLVANTAMVVGTSSWREQFVEAFSVLEGGDDEEEEGGEPAQPTVSDYAMHYISLFWKILLAFCPPTGKNSLSLSSRLNCLRVFC